MQTNVIFRHTESSGRLRTLAETEVEKLRRVYAQIDGAQVTFSEDGLIRKVEARLNVPGHDPVCSAEGTSHEDALDHCVASLRRALVKRKEQEHDHNPARETWH